MSVLLCALLLALEPSSVLEELEQLDRTLAASEHELLQVAKEAEQLRARIAKIQADIASARLEAQAAKQRYTRRVRALARLPAGTQLAVLGESGSFADYLAASRLLRVVARYDRKTQLEYGRRADELVELERALGAEKDRLAGLVRQERDKREAVAARRAEKFARLEEVLADATRSRAAFDELSRAARALATMIQRQKPTSTTRALQRSKGQLPWPTAGRVTAGFGEPEKLGGRSEATRSGLDIRAPLGQRVQAVAPGVVAFAGWIKGYGQAVLIDHGEEFFTLSAHLATIGVAEQDAVIAGTPVGTVGDSGSLDGTRLYFELTHRGVAIDPRPWLKR